MNLKALYDRTDEKWAHPELAAQYAASNSAGCQDAMYDFGSPLEERKKQADGIREFMYNLFNMSEDSPENMYGERYQAPGCPEEPETSVEVVVYRPKNPGKKKLNAIFEVPSGGLYMAMVEVDARLSTLADRYNAVIIMPRYRTSLEAQYPSIMNDCHAAWIWMMENADMLNINPKKVLIEGNSSGSHLALSLCHRLKRYGQKPCGCVVQGSLIDNRPIYSTSNIYTSWSAAAQWKASLQYLGFNNVSCNNGPEMYPIYATAEECVGLPPTFIHSDSEDSSAAACRAYADKLTEAGVYNELHCWGGSSHDVAVAAYMNSPDLPYVQRYMSVVDANIRDCWKYDLSRSWIVDLVNED